MKRLLLTALFVCFIPSMLFADEVDKGLPTDTSSRIKDSARQAIQAGINASALIKMTQSMIADSFSEDQIVAGHEILMKAKKQNLDLAEEDIINKLHEGIAKNQQAEKILQAMETYRARHEFANTRSQSMKTDEQQGKVLTKQIVDSLTAGMDESSMNKLIGMLQQKTKNTGKDEATKLSEKTLETARTMARSGVDSKDIVDVMSNAFNRNYNAVEMEKLGNTFMTQAKRSTSAPALARAYSEAIRNGVKPDQLGDYNPGTPSSIGGFAGPGGPPAGGIGGGSPPAGAGMAGGSGPPGGGDAGRGSAPPAGGGIGAAAAPPGAGGMGAGPGGTPGGMSPGQPGTPPAGAPGGERK